MIEERLLILRSRGFGGQHLALLAVEAFAHRVLARLRYEPGMRGREMRVPFDHLHRFMAEYFGNLHQIVVSLKIGPGSSGRRSYPWGRPSSMARSMLLRVRA